MGRLWCMVCCLTSAVQPARLHHLPMAAACLAVRHMMLRQHVDLHFP